MEINHRGRYIGVSHEILHCADIDALLEKMGGEAMAGSMKASPSNRIHGPNRGLDTAAPEFNGKDRLPELPFFRGSVASYFFKKPSCDIL